MVFALDVAMFHTLDIVYVYGGCIDLVGCPWWGKIEWLKKLSIYGGMLRRFKDTMFISPNQVVTSLKEDAQVYMILSSLEVET